LNREESISARWVYVALLAFGLGFVLFPPRAFLVVDEERYVSQAMAFSAGRLTVPGAEILFPPTPTHVISNFPPGTSLLQAPLVWVGGWRAAALLSALALVCVTLIVMRWLRESGVSPAFALVIPGFFGASFFGRIAMSDVPSTALVAGAVYMIWLADGRRPWISMAAGFLAGATLLFREPPIVLLAPVLAGALLRRRCVPWALIAGLAAGLGLRLALSRLLFGSALYVRPSGYGFSVGALAHSIPVYGCILFAMFPGALLLPVFYRGPRRPELVSAVLLYTGLFLVYQYDSVRENGWAKGLILSSRYVVPMTPLLTFMAAHVLTDWYRRLREHWRRIAVIGVRLGAAYTIALAFLVHPLAHLQEAVPLAIITTVLQHTQADVPVITNTNATLKYFSPSYGARKLVVRYAMNGDSAAAFTQRFGHVNLVLLDRTDSEMFREETLANARFVNAMRVRCDVRSTADTVLGAWAHVRTYEVSRCTVPHPELP